MKVASFDTLSYAKALQAIKNTAKELRQEMESLTLKLTVRLGSLLTVAVGVLAVVVKL